MFVMAFNATILQHLHSGPALSQLGMQYVKNNFVTFGSKLINSTFVQDMPVEWWWKNSIYSQNVIDQQQICLGHTWYLATDMQG
jgi:hypothetical protein